MSQPAVKGISFIIFIIILQQVDGNFIEPKILGNTTGLSAFWVIFAIFLGGGLFGFVGMLIGVPLFGVVYYIIQMFINSRLEKKQLPSHSDYYDEMSYVDDNGTYVRSQEPSPRFPSVSKQHLVAHISEIYISHFKNIAADKLLVKLIDRFYPLYRGSCRQCGWLPRR